MKRFLTSESGSASIELALLMPVLLFLVLGVIDYSIAIERQICVNTAAAAGAAYASLPGKALDVPGVQAASTAAAGTLPMQATASAYATCAAGGPQVDPSSTCSGGTAPMQWIEVHTSAASASIFAFPGLPTTLSLSATVIRRVLR